MHVRARTAKVLLLVLLGSVLSCCHADHFILEPGSLGSTNGPRYQRLDVSKPAASQRRVEFDSTLLRQAQTVSTSTPSSKQGPTLRESIITNVDCDLSDVDWITPEEATLLCSRAQTSFKRASKRISKVVFLTTPIIVNITFNSYCVKDRRWTGDAGDGVPCKWSGNLGSAAPYAFSTFDKAAAENLNLDSDYMYPSALIRQHAPDDQLFAESNYIDISAAFNADAPWWFASSASDESGENIAFDYQARNNKGSYSWSFFSQEPSEIHKKKVFDLEQVAIHELMHGLGIISSWYQWLSTDTLLPGYPMLTPMSASNGFTPLTLSKGYIFDKFIFDSRGKVWMRDYADAIRMEFEKLGKEIWPPNTPASALSWSDPRANNLTENFMRTDGWKLATYIRQVVTRTPRGLTFWYPAPSIRKRKGGSRANNVSGRWRYVVLYTPLDYSGGSSISHVDALLYYGTAQYLMRPFGSAGTSTDSFSPQEKYGPVGEALLGMLRALGYATALGPLNFVP